MQLTITTNEENDKLNIAAAGRFNHEIVEEFRDTYAGQAFTECTIDFLQTEYMDSSGLGMLLVIKSDLGEKCNIKLRNCREDVARILKIARFDQLFDVEF